MTISNGIRVEKISLPKIDIEQLYIKLDKKLIVSVEKIDIKFKSDNKTSTKELKNILNYLPYMYAMFDSVSIRELHYNNKKMHFLYKDKIFYVDSDFLSIDSTICTWEDSVEFKIEHLMLKDFNVELKGNLTLNLKTDNMRFQGNFSTFNIDGALNLKIKNKLLSYKISTKKFNTLKPFMDFISQKINLEPLIGDWIYKKIVANEYKLRYLEGKFDLETDEFYPYQMKARASAKKAIIKFDDNAPPAIAQDLDVVLKNDTLIFEIKKATFEGKDISKSEVYIYNLLTKGSGIIVDIKADTMLDNSIHKVLKAFNIDIPITQTQGTTKANVKLDIGFEPFVVKSYTGTFLLEDSNLSISGVPMYSSFANVVLDNELVYIKNSNLRYSNVFDINTSGIFDISSSKYESQNYINSLHVELGSNELLDLNDINTSSLLILKEDEIEISLNELDTLLKFGKTNEITIKNLKNIQKYSKIMKQLNINDADVFVKTDDFKNYDIFTNIKDINLPIFNNGKKLTSLQVEIKTDGKDFEAISKDNHIKIKQTNSLHVEIDVLDIALNMKDTNGSINLKQNLQLEGINSNILDTNSNKKLLSEEYNLEINNGNEIYFDSKLFNQTLHVEKNENSFYVDSDNLSDLYVNSLLGKNVFENGVFQLKIDGKSLDSFDGIFYATNTTMKGMTFYNNLIALINTIPSLLTFKTPGFNEKGYSINSMLLDFKRTNDIIHIDEIKIDGKSTDVIGHGTYNIATNEVDLTLQLAILKSLSSIVKNIPIVNYIVLGDNGKIYTQINVTGTVENLNIKTNIISDTVSSPMNIIKRTIQTPFKIFK